MSAGGSRLEPMVPTMPPFSRLGRAVFPGWEKYVWDLLDVEINGPLMLGCSNVHIIGEFTIFGVIFNASCGDSYEG